MITDILYYSAALALIMIAREDLRQRQIHIAWFAVLLPIIITASLLKSSIIIWLTMLGYNLIAASLILSVGLLFVAIRHSIKLKDFSNMIGAGDLLLIAILCISVSTPLFFIVFMCSLIFSLIYCLGCFITKRAWKKVPLAGIMAALLAILLVVGTISSAFSLLDGSWFFQKLFAPWAQ